MVKDNLEISAEKLAHYLLQRKATLATAESCTGGGVAYTLTALPGSSDWFGYGYVTYANAAKSDMIDVDDTLISEYGAVSEQVAIAMAQGALKKSGADYALSITGVAGPSGGSKLKPIGTVFFSWSDKIGRNKVALMHFDGDREQIRKQAIMYAINGLIDFIDEYEH